MLGRRPDGYHEVKTILQTVSLQDDLEFEGTRDGAIHLSCDCSDIPVNDGNLIVRAAKSLKQRYNIRDGARMRLVKRIPAQAGLGGGSSNAAVTLLALTRLWNAPTRAGDLLAIAAGLGADVPFFLFGGVALGTGTGATISPLADDAQPDVHHLIVISPNATVSTPDAYQALNLPALTTWMDDPILSSSHAQANSGDSQQRSTHNFSLSDLRNDFEAVIFDIEPEIRRAREALLESGALGALLAGSGSSVFGIFADASAQQRALERMRVENGWRIFPCVTLSRDEYHRRLGPELFQIFQQGY